MITSTHYPSHHIKSFCYFIHIHTTTSFVSFLQSSNMSSTCDNCDCADKSQCTKKRSSFGVEIVQKNYNMSYEMDQMGENDCKCGPSCTCTSCTCHSA